VTEPELEKSSRAFATTILNALEGDLAEQGSPLPEGAREGLLLVMQLCWNRGYQTAMMEALKGRQNVDETSLQM